MSIRKLLPDHRLFTIASLEGWGAHFDNQWEMQGKWELYLSYLHINFIKFCAIKLAVEHFLLLLSRSRLMIFTDNTAALAYVKNRGGTRSRQLFFEADEILTAQHIAGKLNVWADRLSIWGSNSDGMAVAPIHLCDSISPVGIPVSRSVTDEVEQSVANICLPIHRQLSPGYGRLSIPWTNIPCVPGSPPTAFFPHEVISKIWEDGAKFILVAQNWPASYGSRIFCLS